MTQTSPQVPAVSDGGPAPVAEIPQHKKITEYTLSPELEQKARTLGRIRFAFRIFSIFYAVFALWLILSRKLSMRFRDRAERVSQNRFVQGLVYTPLFVITFALLQLPLDLFSEILFKSYGISVQSWSSWARDWTIALVLTIVVGAIFASILYALIRASSRLWWFYFWLVSLPILLFLFFLQPVLIDPLFNKFEPLSAKAPELIPQLERITQRAGVPIPRERMFWMLASDKTIYTNAYVTGIGASKRVVIWDTSLSKETPGGVLEIFGHELGHYALQHIWKGIAFALALIFLVLFLVSRVFDRFVAHNSANWGIRNSQDWASMPALLMLAFIFGFPASVAGVNFSRYQEHQADIYALEVTHGIVPDAGQEFAASFQKFGEQVFVDPHPNAIYVFLFADHPTVADRVRFAASYDPWNKGEAPKYVK